MAETGATGQQADVAVVGAGPAGLTAAIALARAGLDTVLVSTPARAADNRTTALLASSVAALDMLGVWPRCHAEAAPLAVMRIVDATGRLWRAPEARFAAGEIGLDAFGWNIENTHLVAALDACADELSNLRRVMNSASAVEIGESTARITLAGGGSITAHLVVGADGRRSLCRVAAGVTMDSHSYPQVALTFTLRHTRPHHNISTEFHTEHGPFTLVPLNGQRSSLVWVTSPDEADWISAFSEDELNAEIEQRSHSILGKVSVEQGRGSFPLAIDIARAFAACRIVLVGEAAHALPPIGAQGLNLGLRDAAAIGEIATQAHRDGGDIGGDAVTARYDRERRADIVSRARAVDWLNRSLLSDFMPVQATRGLGLYLINRIGPLRRAVMRTGIAPGASARGATHDERV